jgi:hypothetical protein
MMTYEYKIVRPGQLPTAPPALTNPPPVKIIAMTEYELEILIRRVAQVTVAEVLAAQKSPPPADAAAPDHPPSQKRAPLSPAEVRQLAKCGANQVYAGLKSGRLRGRKEKMKNRITCQTPDGEREIHSRSRKDAKTPVKAGVCSFLDPILALLWST